MANFLTKLLSSGAGSFVDAVGNAVDKFTTTDEERKALENELAKARMQYDIEVATLGLRETEAYLADTQSARTEQSRVQESQHASWLAKNVQPSLAVAIVGLTFWMYYHIIFGSGTVLKDPNSPMKDIVIYVLGALTTVSTQVVSYFFGSSQGSSDKSKLIKNLAEKK